MNTINSKRGRLVLLGLGASAIAAIAPIGSATADAPAGAAAKAAQIKMVGSGKDLSFDGPKTIAVGEELEIVNETNPKKEGPHSFSLVKRKFIPQTNKEMKKCEICQPIGEAHKVDFETGEVGKDTVEKGKDGWDKQFTDEKFGDSWYTEKKNDSQTRVVSAKAGKKLGYFCAIHPFMSGKIEVVD